MTIRWYLEEEWMELKTENRGGLYRTLIPPYHNFWLGLSLVFFRRWRSRQPHSMTPLFTVILNCAFYLQQVLWCCWARWRQRCNNRTQRRDYQWSKHCGLKINISSLSCLVYFLCLFISVMHSIAVEVRIPSKGNSLSKRFGFAMQE